ncbi:MAG: phytanoyl-CoA dioxygenase family protein [bacterium]|nr:phytanoyl-CoA dioxygenase family protein [bacterium]
MTNTQRLEFESRGYLTLDINADDLAHLQAAFDQTEDGLDDLPNHDDRFIHLAEHPDFFPVVHHILSDDVQLRSLTGSILPPKSPGRGWHREVAGLLGVHHPISTLYLQALVHLDERPENGACFMVVPGSHRFKSDLPFPEITSVEDMPQSVAPSSKAGTVTLLHGNLWQARTQNRSDTSQRFLELAYVHCWMRHALPALSPHAEGIVQASSSLSQLFALRDLSNASGYWQGELEGQPSGLPERKFSPLKVVGKGTVPNRGTVRNK